MKPLRLFAFSLAAAAGFAALAGGLGAEERATMRLDSRAASGTTRAVILPAPTLPDPRAIVTSRDGRFTLTVAVTRVTSGIDVINCAVTISNADSTVLETANGDATLLSGNNYRCILTVNYNWNGIDDTAPLRIDMGVSGINSLLSGSTSYRSTNQTKVVPVPADGSVTALSFATRL